MSFVSPLALAWAALTIPIVIFYILKIRLRQVPVSTTIFWQQIYDEKSPRSLWQQLRHWLSLLVQIVWLLLLVLALAEPFFSWELLASRRLVLVIDNSASMNADDVAPSRLAAAKQAALAQVASLRFRDTVAIIAAGTQPRVICGLTNHERTLQAAVKGIAPSDGPARVSEAVEVAKRLLAEAPHGQVLVYSDGGFSKSDLLASDPLVKLHPIGTAAANVGITRFQVRRSLLDPVGYEILVEVTNASEQASNCRLDIDLNDLPVDVIPLQLAPGQTWSQTFEKTSIDGGRLVARLDIADALQTDNSALALLPQRKMQRVLLISPGSLFLQKALAANPLVELTTVRELPASYEPGVIHVFHRLVPAKLPPGSSLVVDPLTGSDLWELTGPLDSPIVTKQDTDSALMRHVRLDNVILPQARQLKPIAAGSHVLVEAVTGDPLYFAIDGPRQKTLVLTVNLDQGDLTFRTAFPILMTNALGWFAGQAGELQESLASGAVAEIALTQEPPADQEVMLKSPQGVTRPLPAQNNKASIGPLDQVGIWKVELHPSAASKSPEITVVQELACNLGSRSESDLRVPESWQASAPEAMLAGSWFVRPIWIYLITLGWLLAVLEWFLYQRRWIS